MAQKKKKKIKICLNANLRAGNEIFENVQGGVG